MDRQEKMSSDRYQARCHCERVKVSFLSKLNDPFLCNCSFCRRRSAPMQRVEPADFTLHEGKKVLRSYGSRDFSTHYFCGHCGIYVFTELHKKNKIAVSLSCVDEIDLQSLTIAPFDGRNTL